MQLTREYFCAKILYDFKVKLNQAECLQRLQFAWKRRFITVFRWIIEFRRGRNSFLHEENRKTILNGKSNVPCFL